MYMAIKNTGQFETACVKWKLKQPANRATKQQSMIHFGEAYEIFDAKNNTLHTAGIANNAELQSSVQTAQDNINTIQDKLAQSKADNAALHVLLKNAVM